MNVIDSTTAKEGSGIFMSKTVTRAGGGREKAQRRNREFAAWMVGLSFAGDVLAVFAGLRLAFSLRFDTPMRFLGHPSSEPMTLWDYHGHFFFLTVTMLIVLFLFRVI